MMKGKKPNEYAIRPEKEELMTGNVGGHYFLDGKWRDKEKTHYTDENFLLFQYEHPNLKFLGNHVFGELRTFIIDMQKISAIDPETRSVLISPDLNLYHTSIREGTNEHSKLLPVINHARRALSSNKQLLLIPLPDTIKSSLYSRVQQY